MLLNCALPNVPPCLDLPAHLSEDLELLVQPEIVLGYNIVLAYLSPHAQEATLEPYILI